MIVADPRHRSRAGAAKTIEDPCVANRYHGMRAAECSIDSLPVEFRGIQFETNKVKKTDGSGTMRHGVVTWDAEDGMNGRNERPAACIRTTGARAGFGR